MTSVRNVYEAAVRDGSSWVALPVTAIRPAASADGVPYARAVLGCAPLDAATRALLDPRQQTAVRWRVRQVRPDGTTTGYLPRVGAGTGQYAQMHVRTVQRTLSGVTITLSGAEALLDDKLNLGPNEDGVITPTTRGLVEWALSSTLGGAPDVTATDATATAVLTAKPWRPYIGVGESFMSILEAELNSLGCRLFDLWGLQWVVATRDAPPTYATAPALVKVSSHEDVPADVDPIILDLTETISRDGDWADAVAVRGETTTDGYVATWQHLARQAAHSKGLIVDTGRQEPSGNLAQSIASRAAARGHDLTLTCRARLDILPGMTLETHTLAGVITSTIIGVAWDLEAGTMTIQSRSAIPADIDDASRSETGPTDTPASVAARLRSLTATIAPAIEKTTTIPEPATRAWESAQIIGGAL